MPDGVILPFDIDRRTLIWEKIEMIDWQYLIWSDQDAASDLRSPQIFNWWDMAENPVINVWISSLN